MRHFVGIDGGGTRTTLALADETGHELLRRGGPAGLVDPQRPEAAAQMIVDLVGEALQAAGVRTPVSALCAGLAGVGSPAERSIVQRSLEHARLAERVWVMSDGETALYGAFAGGPGILLVAGTGSVGYGRGEDGRLERCGGWGMVVGDEGSGYALGRAGLRAALRSVDSREKPTRLLPLLLEVIGVPDAEAIPPWAGRARKAEVAALAVHVLRLAAEGDDVAARVVRDEARQLASHATALVERLAPWSGPPPLVLHGGVAREAVFRAEVERALAELPLPPLVTEPRADAVAGALSYAARASR